MPTVRIPLVGSFSQRGMDADAALVLAEDQRFKNCVFNVVQNPVTGKATAYAEKRPGWVQDSIPASGSPSTGLIVPQSFTATISAFGDTNSTIYSGTTSVGAITGRAVSFGETIISSVKYITIKSSDGTGWYYADGAKDDLTYVGDTHNGTAIIDSLDNTTGVYSGQAWSGTGVAAGARVLTVDSASQITLNANSTADGTDITFTKTPIAKILDAQFDTSGNPNGAFVEMDGFLFYTDGTSVKNSDINSIINYTAGASKSADMSPDNVVGIARSKNVIIVFGTGSYQGFQNAGYSSGSPLERIAQTFNLVGCQGQSTIATMENDIYFLGSSQYGDVTAWRIRGLTPSKISPGFVDKIMGTVNATQGTNYVSAFHLGGEEYLLVTMSNAQEGTTGNILLESGDALLLESGDNILLEGNASEDAAFSRQLVYNTELNIWSEWDAMVSTFVVGQGYSSNNAILATSRFGTGGKIYRINPAADGNVYTDDGTAYDMEIRTAKIDHGSNVRKIIPRIRLIADTQTSGSVTLEASDDDYQTWKTLGTFDLTRDDKTIHRCGSYKGGRAYRLTHSAAAAFRAEAIEIDYEMAA